MQMKLLHFNQDVSHPLARQRSYKSIINSLAPDRMGWKLRWIILKLILVISEIAFKWMSRDLTADKLVGI